MNERIERITQQALEQPEGLSVDERLREAGVLIEVLAGMLFEQGVLDVKDFVRRKISLDADIDQALAEVNRQHEESLPPKALAFWKKIQGDFLEFD